MHVIESVPETVRSATEALKTEVEKSLPIGQRIAKSANEAEQCSEDRVIAQR